MDPVTYGNGQAPFSTLKLSDVLWRPWYAKAWWASAAVFWCATAFVPGAAKAMDGGFVLALSLVLHPFALMWYLASRYLWDWRKALAFPSKPRGTVDSDHVAGVGDCSGGEDFGVFWPRVMPYLNDPTDVRSPLNPANPLNPSHPSNRH
ncbi:hypothetical protein [Sphingobium sp. SA916]|uniref:hypothetical protein n=1 Tax=Sphingobium sp. SA916 TaxID=1851207 RepID=UPI0011AFCA9E|nr:hypothetical protein [Sphingobium sp. SA916]